MPKHLDRYFRANTCVSEKRYACKLCPEKKPKTYKASSSGTTTALLRHLRQCHPEAYVETVKNKEVLKVAKKTKKDQKAESDEAETSRRAEPDDLWYYQPEPANDDYVEEIFSWNGSPNEAIRALLAGKESMDESVTRVRDMIDKGGDASNVLLDQISTTINNNGELNVDNVLDKAETALAPDHRVTSVRSLQAVAKYLELGVDLIKNNMTCDFCQNGDIVIRRLRTDEIATITIPNYLTCYMD